MTIKTTVSFDDELGVFVDEMIAAGRYPNRSAVFQAGLERLRRETEDEVMERDALRMLIAERRAETPISSAEMDARLERLFQNAARGDGVEP